MLTVITNQRIEAAMHAAHILRDRQTIVTDADGWHTLKSAMEYLWAEHSRAQLWQAGFCQSPNAPIAGPGTEWYASGPGIKEPVQGQEIRLCGNQCGIVETEHTGEPYTNTFQYTWKWVLSPRTVPEVIDWLSVNGQLSAPGLPAFSNSWD